MKILLLIVDPTKITKPGPLENLSFEWWYLLIVPIWIFGLWFIDYVRKNKYKNN
ncbi:hypothetical protein [Aquimarina megaterium]|uniref:hypothetical protein n=1 Tax=Aquimarina megaterium TaxID=1443666 RepID=UPI001586B14E|nr:hypothetical protein [Aquimarina megaterium]